MSREPEEPEVGRLPRARARLVQVVVAAVSWTPRAHSAALRHRAWHHPPAPRPRRQAPPWEALTAQDAWVRRTSPDSVSHVAWVTRHHRWSATYVGCVSRYPEDALMVGEYPSAELACAAVDAQLRSEGWDT